MRWELIWTILALPFWPHLGTAIADLLFGDFSPSGRLPVSFPARSGQQPYFYNHASSGRPCVGKNRAYKNCWRTLGNAALYPFGHGLTYTSFEYGAPTFIPAAGMPWDGEIKITTKVTNTGTRTGEEVVQLYVHDVAASRVRPVRELKGFSKIELDAGETQEVTFVLTRSDVSFAALDRTAIESSGNGKTVEPGMFDVWVTASAAAGNATQFELLGPDRRSDL